MGILSTLLEAVNLGVQAKAQKDASAKAQKRMDKAHGTCTPCAAGAKVQQFREQAQDRMGVPSRGRR